MYIVIMAGGSGTRFWPASRDSQPKQFLNIIGSATLIEQTFSRVASLGEEAKTYLVINERHRALTERLFAGRRLHILTEPVGRNTAPCIGLAALHVQQQAGDEPMVVLPADHFIADESAFRATLLTAAHVAESGAIVTIGITPTRPETGYGYILMGAPHDPLWSHPVYRVERFVEKPDQATALEYLRSGRYLWNSGIFVFTANTILQEMRQHLPAIEAGLRRLQPHLGRPTYPTALAEVYADWPSISIDYGIMEHTTRPVYVVPGTFGWSDVGSWEALYELRRHEHDTAANLNDAAALLLDARGSFVYSRTGRLIALLGVHDVLVVDTPDAVLVADLKRSQEVRRITEALNEQNKTERDVSCR